MSACEGCATGSAVGFDARGWRLCARCIAALLWPARGGAR